MDVLPSERDIPSLLQAQSKENERKPYRISGKAKIIFFLGAQPGDKNFLQTNFCAKSAFS
jgi:hypothetical protein